MVFFTSSHDLNKLHHGKSGEHRVQHVLERTINALKLWAIDETGVLHSILGRKPEIYLLCLL